jgi:putative NIF3 family GTP cyclohydrolase 1 type 2
MEDAVTARELIGWLDQRVPGADSDVGFKFGDPGAEVTGVLVCWMADLEALGEAVAKRCNLVICHETLFYPQSAPIDSERCWATNRRRMELMHRGSLTVYRAHGRLDRLCIFDDFAAALGLHDVCAGTGHSRVFAIPPTPVGDLVERAKKAAGMPVVRVIGDLQRRVTRVGLPWGGLGLFINVGFMQQVVENGAEVGICGETDEYAMRFAEDAGMALIETSHAACENIGLRHFAAMLAEAYPGITVSFHDSGPKWRTA